MADHHGGVIEKAGVLDRLISPIINSAKSAGAAIASLVGAVIATNIAAADQYIAIVLPGRMFKRSFSERGLAPIVLSRTVGASGTPTSALIPWNSCGAYMAVTLGVATLSYAPFAVFNLVSPLLAILFGYAGWRTESARPEQALQHPKNDTSPDRRARAMQTRNRKSARQRP